MKAIASNGVEIQTGDAVLARCDNNEKWRYSIFSHKDSHSYVTSSFSYYFCIPYKGNENLVGTTKNFNTPKVENKFEFKFGVKVKAYGATNTANDGGKIGVLIDYDKDDPYYSYRVAFPTEDNTKGNMDWFSEIEYLD